VLRGRAVPYVFSVGSTGDSPVPAGDPPDGTGSGIERKGTVSPHADISAIPPGGSPGGAGESPALPSLNGYAVPAPLNHSLRFSGRPHSP